MEVCGRGGGSVWECVEVRAVLCGGCDLPLSRALLKWGWTLLLVSFHGRMEEIRAGEGFKLENNDVIICLVPIRVTGFFVVVLFGFLPWSTSSNPVRASVFQLESPHLRSQA